MLARRAPRPRTGRLAAVVAAALIWTGAPPAGAEGVADEAELHFELGAEAYAKGELRTALEHFFLSNRLAPNRNVVFNIARTFEQMKRYADAHRHYVDALQGETDPQAIRDVSAAIARIAPNVAVLDVVTSPPGATVYIDRRELGSRGRAPRKLALPPGSYRVIAELEGYEPAVSAPAAATLGGTTRIELALTRIVGTVHVEVTGAKHAVVRADDERGEPLCTAPCDAALPPGSHQLYFESPGFFGAPRQVTVSAGRTVHVVAEMILRTGSLLVRSDELGAAVLVGGKTMGFTPGVIPNVPAGEQRVKIMLHGYRPVEQTVEIKPGEQTALDDVRLAPVHEVTAVSRYAEQVDDAPSSVTVIDGQELRAFGYPTIAEALRGVRGVYLLNDRAYQSIGIRGLGQPNDYGNRVLVLSDGQPMNDNLLNSSYVGSDGRSDLHDVERIEVVRGPGSLLYGTGAISGVINLVTRPRDEPNSVHVGFGTYDDAAIRARAGFHYNFGPDRGIWASVSTAASDGVAVVIPVQNADGSTTPTTAQGTDRFAAGGTAGRFWWGPFTVQWFFHTREQHIPVGAYGTVVNDDRTQFTDTRYMAEARFEPRLGKTVELMTRLHANRYTFLGDYVVSPAPAPVHEEHYYGTWFGAEARVAVTPVAWLRLTGGGEGQVSPQAALQGCCTQGTNLNYLDVSKPYQFGAAYALAEGSPLAWLRVSAGARVDVYSTFGAIVVPRAALIFKPAKGTAIKLMGGRAFRAPSIYELYYNDGGASEAAGLEPARHLTLAPESVYSGELEVSQRFLDDWVALVTGHVSYVEQLIRTIDDMPGNSNVLRYANTPPVLAIGGEAEIRREWRRGWMLGAAYAYQSARITTPTPGDPDSRIAAYPDHMASLRAVAPLIPELVSPGVRVTLEGSRRISTIDDARTAPAVIGDVTLSGNIKPFGVHYVLGVYNVANFQWQMPVAESFKSRTVPQNGRTLMLDVLGTYP
jgi:outer membrane receptor for ferrienterochelin and colicins